MSLLHPRRSLIIPLTDPTAPLLGSEQQNSGTSVHALSSTPSMAILDVADNMRAKIYAMLYRIGNESKVY